MKELGKLIPDKEKELHNAQKGAERASHEYDEVKQKLQVINNVI